MSHEKERNPTLYAEGECDDDVYEEKSITSEEECEKIALDGCECGEDNPTRSYSLKLDFNVGNDGVPELEITGKIRGKFEDEANPALAAIAEFRNK